jgi:hypothetical protein
MLSGGNARAVQFRTLYRVFFLRAVDLDLLSADADLTRLMGQFASIFCTFSFVLSVPLLLMNGATLLTNDAWGMEHFLIDSAMTVAGLITVLNWDAAFPDKQDLLILTPLPVKKTHCFSPSSLVWSQDQLWQWSRSTYSRASFGPYSFAPEIAALSVCCAHYLPIG